MVVTTWGLHEPHLSHENILQESLIISAAWKWLGEKEVYEAHINPARPRQDLGVIKALHKVLGEADIVVGHNSERFDMRKFAARAIKHKLTPLPPVQSIDTLKIARKYFSFNSNRLDYLGRFLCGEGKIHTDYHLWLDVMNGSEEALAKMVTYNKQDVVLLEKVFLRLRPFIRNGPNAATFKEDFCCPNCGGGTLQKRGFLYQRTTKRQRYQCKDCFAWSSGAFVSRAKVK